jgi:hypothetical protein
MRLWTFASMRNLPGRTVGCCGGSAVPVGLQMAVHAAGDALPNTGARGVLEVTVVFVQV